MVILIAMIIMVTIVNFRDTPLAIPVSGIGTHTGVLSTLFVLVKYVPIP